MSSSCNGSCNGCAPNFSFFAIGTAAAIIPGGFPCLIGETPEGTVYTTRISSGGGSSTAGFSDNPNETLCCWGPGNGDAASGGSYFVSEDYVRKVDQYGSYIQYVSYSSSNMSFTNNSSQYEPIKGDSRKVKSSYVQNSNVTCSNDNPEIIIRCEEDCSWSSSFIDEFFGIDEKDSGTSCTGASSCGPTEGDCTSISCSEQAENYFNDETTGYSQWSNSSSNATSTLAGPIEILSKGRTFSTQRVNTRNSILRSNQAQNKDGVKCGNGQDACWIGQDNDYYYPIFVPVDNSENTYKAKAYVKVATFFESMQGIKSISGIVYFYGLESEDEQLTCPGENTTFDNPPIISASFSIGNRKNFKDEFSASQEILLDNDSLQSYTGLHIVASYKVTNVAYE
jgi:hypothetical protein